MKHQDIIDAVRTLIQDGATQAEAAAKLNVTQPYIAQMVGRINNGSGRNDLCTDALHAARTAEMNALDAAHFSWFRSLTYHATTLSRGHKLLPFTLLPSEIFPIPEVCPLSGTPLSVVDNQTGPMVHRGISAGYIRIDPSIGYVKGNILVVHRRIAAIYKGSTLMDIARTSAALLKLAKQSKDSPTHLLTTGAKP